MNISKIGGRSIEALYEDYSDMLFRLALSHLGKKEDAEDVVHDVFIKYYDSALSFTDLSHEKAWLIRVTINKCRDLFRRKAVRKYIPIWDMGANEPSCEDSYGEIFDIINELDMKYRAAVSLHYLEGYSVEETANILGISLSAAKMRLSRAREALKEKM